MNLKLETRVVVALNLTGALPAGTRFEVEFSAIMNQPWAGLAVFDVAVETRDPTPEMGAAVRLVVGSQ